MESQLIASTRSLKELPSSRPLWNPHDYQKRAVKLLLSQGSAGLFLDPGLGKTSICLAAVNILKKQGMCRKTLIIAPLRCIYKVWPDEIKKWHEFRDLSYQILHGSKKAASLAIQSDINLINPEGLPWLAKTGKLKDYDLLIVDESSRFKDSRTQRFRCLKDSLPFFRRRWILTGTPVPNGLMDLFGQMFILDLGRSLGRFITHYRREFFIESGYGGYSYTPKPDSFGRIVDRVSPLILQLSAEDYLQMPKLQNITVAIDLPPEVRKRYDRLDEEFIIEDLNIIGSTSAVVSGKLRQIANGAVYDQDGTVVHLHDEKLEAVESILEELGGAPVLIFYEFNHDRDRLKRLLGDSVPILGGGLSEKKLTAIIDGFNAGDIPVLLGHPGSMGHGLNLQGSCNRVIWFGIPWDYELYRQAISRVYRQGQTSDTVLVYHIIATNTKDEHVVKVLTAKEACDLDVKKALSSHRQEYLDAT